MNRTHLNLIGAVVLVVGIGALVLAQKQSVPDAGNGTASSSTTALQEVSAHNTREDCWTIINGNVYDLTSWIPQHPGGEAAILQLCGTDGSSKFNGQHGGAARQAAILAGFKVDGSGTAAVQQPTAPVADDDDDAGDDRGRNRRGRDSN